MIKIRQIMTMHCCLILVYLSAVACGNGAVDPGDTRRTFYVDSIAGNDAFDGQSPSTAWQSVAQVNAFPLVAGDSVKFKCGGIFPGGIELGVSGTAAGPITFDEYGTGTHPVLLGSRTETDWTLQSGSIYKKEITYVPGKTGAGIVLQDGVPLRFKSWNIDAATSLGADAGVFTYDPADLFTATLYVRCTDSAAPSTHIMDAGHFLFGVHAVNSANIVINNLCFKNFSGHGIIMKRCTSIAIRNCRAENIGGAVVALSPALLYAGNGFEFSHNSENCTVVDSQAINVFDSGFSPQVFESNTVTRNITFQNCIAEKCGFAGFEISVLSYNGTNNEGIETVRVLGCTVAGSGKGWSGVRYGSEGHGIRIKADAGAGTITGVSVEQTTVSDCEGSGIYIAGEAGTVTVHRCRLDNNKQTGILCAGTAGVTSLGLKLTSSLILNHAGSAQGIGYTAVAGNGFEIINNTFCNNSLAFYIGACGGNAVLKNNIFYSANIAHVGLYAASHITPLASDYNCFYEHGGNIIGWISNAYTSLAGFTSATGLDQHSIGSDPVFAAPALDWHLQAVSSCKNSGTAAGVIDDYEGNPFDGTAPSRGAYR